MSAATMPAQRVCRGCGCTDEDGCLVRPRGLFAMFGDEELTGCSWVEADLCSGCRWPEDRERGPVVDRRSPAQ